MNILTLLISKGRANREAIRCVAIGSSTLSSRCMQRDCGCLFLRESFVGSQSVPGKVFPRQFVTKCQIKRPLFSHTVADWIPLVFSCG